MYIEIQKFSRNRFFRSLLVNKNVYQVYMFYILSVTWPDV